MLRVQKWGSDFRRIIYALHDTKVTRTSPLLCKGSNSRSRKSNDLEEGQGTGPLTV
jgi:hypothetical protein